MPVATWQRCRGAERSQVRSPEGRKRARRTGQSETVGVTHGTVPPRPEEGPPRRGGGRGGPKRRARRPKVFGPKRRARRPQEEGQRGGSGPGEEGAEGGAGAGGHDARDGGRVRRGRRDARRGGADPALEVSAGAHVPPPFLPSPKRVDCLLMSIACLNASTVCLSVSTSRIPTNVNPSKLIQMDLRTRRHEINVLLYCYF